MTAATPRRHPRAFAVLVLAAAILGLAAIAGRASHFEAASGSAGSARRNEDALKSARPAVELVDDRDGSVTLRFSADETSCFGTASTFVRVPDGGRIDVSVGACEFASLGQSGESNGKAQDPAELLEVSEPAIMRDLRLVRLVFSPAAPDDHSGRYARQLTVTLRATDAPGINEKVSRRLPR
ncbi:MAG: hypothetical protein JXB46_04840, partial [Candidatus Eisenbacteria bacterium]|nr:hypothetical protein [Candidatus Eisenbacteria bacterium]